ncbi:hypothetical protein MKEN_00295100 [Mycena kentingensis (nom. inval.)]|nr:hypothetical protein MKEN_00295100 [Mycena kentingensis (nom. inval.)]
MAEEPLPPHLGLFSEPPPLYTNYNEKINNATTLEKVFTYGPDVVLEYPETSTTGRVGHLFFMKNARSWYNPMGNFAYSLGPPKGQKKNGVTCFLLKDGSGFVVPCKSSHATCQGVKLCFYADPALLQPHTKASRADVARTLAGQQAERDEHASARATLQQKTLAYFVVLQREGCGAPLYEPTIYVGAELDERERQLEVRERIRRGHASKATCEGRLLFMCEHYNRRGNIDHFFDYSPSRGLYDCAYLEALFAEDEDIVAEIEEDALYYSGTGPLAKCKSVANNSSIKVNCTVEHRDEQGRLIVAEMQKSSCTCRFVMYEPLEAYRDACPWILVVCGGAHAHPAPLPTKTPPSLRADIFQLLYSLQYDLPDLTPRRLLRHPSALAFLHKRLPHLENPTFVDLHSSLANRDHIRAYILQVQREVFPEGTGWAGLAHLKQQAELNRVVEDAYIRYMMELPPDSVASRGENDEDDDPAVPFRIIVCQHREASEHLLRAKFVQSDISFRRVAGFLELEVGGMNADSRTMLGYSRILLNRQTAAAHTFAFKLIDFFVQQDTGQALQWRHIHGNTLRDEVGILQFAMDQHGGQALGLGEYLQSLVQSPEFTEKRDLHEPHRLLRHLDPYEHLRRIGRLCTAHVFRNIQKVKLKPEAEHVRVLMKSLVCLTHKDWDGTIARIQSEGGKAGADWINDKIRSKFALPAICWAKSFIPEAIWKIGDNTTNNIEALHADVNREGVSCTLVGGVKKSEHLDMLKLKTLTNWSSTGIRSSYMRGHVSESIETSVKRRANQRHRILGKADAKITTHNERLQKASAAKHKADLRVRELSYLQNPNAQQLGRAVAAAQRADSAYTKAVEASAEMVGSGSGKVPLLLPSSHTSVQ